MPALGGRERGRIHVAGVEVARLDCERGERRIRLVDNLRRDGAGAGLDEDDEEAAAQGKGDVRVRVRVGLRGVEVHRGEPRRLVDLWEVRLFGGRWVTLQDVDDEVVRPELARAITERELGERPIGEPDRAAGDLLVPTVRSSDRQAVPSACPLRGPRVGRDRRRRLRRVGIRLRAAGDCEGGRGEQHEQRAHSPGTRPVARKVPRAPTWACPAYPGSRLPAPGSLPRGSRRFVSRSPRRMRRGRRAASVRSREGRRDRP